ncbi:MAG: hypothetical protein ABI868_02195 [Acidobacteriota bacterium]
MLHTRWRNRAFTLLAAGVLCLSQAGPAAAQDTLGSNVNVLVAWDASDHYITPRGLNVEDKGLVVQPLVLLLWKLHGSDQGAVSDVTLTTGIWNSLHSHRAGTRPSKWNEIDPILGVAVKFRKGFTVDVSTTAFYTPTDAYATSTHAAFKLTYNDAFSKGLTLSPYVSYWRELSHKSTVMFNAATSKESGYLTLGATPSFGLGAGGSSMDISAFANIAGSSFYQRFDGSDGGSGLALVSVSPKLSVPLKFLGVSHGAWKGSVSASYFHLRNAGLLDGNQVLANPERESNLIQFHGGLSVFF